MDARIEYEDATTHLLHVAKAVSCALGYMGEVKERGQATEEFGEANLLERMGDDLYAAISECETARAEARKERAHE